MKLDISGLRPVELSDLPVFENYLQKFASQSSECCFANLYMYRDSYGYEFADLGDRLVVYERVARQIHYPIGKWTSPKELYKISRLFMDSGLTDGGVYDIPEEFLDRYADCDQYFEIEYDEGQIDYMFSIEKIATCAGPKLKKKYNLVKQFQANWPFAELRRIENEEIQAAAKLVRVLNSHLPQCQYIDEENEAIERGLEHFDELKLGGIILYAEKDYPIGMAIYSMLHSDTIDIHFEKADHSVKGAAQTLTRLLALELRGKAKFINCEQDFNDPDLRHIKRSLDPERFFKRYYLRTIN